MFKIPVSGGPSWVQVPMNSNYPSQEIGIDNNKYAPTSEVNKPRASAPTYNPGGSISTTPDLRSFPTVPSPTTPLWTLSPDLYRYYYYQQEEAKEQGRKQQEALITANIKRQLDIAASAQYGVMDRLYVEGGLDALRKEYERVKAGTEGANSVYAKAAHNAYTTKVREEAPIREETTKAANKYYNEGGIENLKYLIIFYKSRGEFNYASVAQNILSAKETEEAINTPAVTGEANNYYKTGGMASLKHLVNYYKDTSDFVNYNIAKRILRQKEEQEREQEHNRRMQQDIEYAENYQIKETENEIRKIENEIEEQNKIDPFAGQPSNDAINARRKAFEYTKGLSYESAKYYLAELSLPANARFENSKIGAAVALQYYFDEVIPLQNKIEQARVKIQEIDNSRTERILKQKEEQEHEKLKQAEKMITKAIEINNTKINRFRNVADMADDILHKRTPKTLDEDFDNDISDILKSTFEGVKEAFVETGTFIGEEAARLHLGEKTKIGHALDKITTFVEEEKQRFDNDEPTETEQALKELGSYIKNEGELIVANERTKTEQFVRNTYQKLKDTPVNEIAHSIGKLGGDMLIGYGMYKGTTNLIKGTGEVVNIINGYNREARAIKHSLGNNPFRGKSFDTIDRMLDKKGFTTKGDNPKNGKGSYFHPTTNRKYYLDKGENKIYNNGVIEKPHVDVHYKNNLGENLEKTKRKYPLGDHLYERVNEKFKM